MPSIKYYLLSDVREPVYINNYVDLLTFTQSEESFEAKVFRQHKWDCDVFVLIPNNFSSVEYIGKYGWDFLFLDGETLGSKSVEVWSDLADTFGFKIMMGVFNVFN